jgi:hypothetical protein
VKAFLEIFKENLTLLKKGAILLHLTKYKMLDTALKMLFSLDSEFTFLLKSINFSRILEVSAQAMTGSAEEPSKEILTGASAQLSTLSSQLVVRKAEEVLKSVEVAK